MATTAGAGGDVHRVLYDAVALCTASCAQRTTTNPTMKGAATRAGSAQFDNSAYCLFEKVTVFVRWSRVVRA